MEHDILDAPATPDRIGRLVAGGVLSGDDAARAYAAASATPSRAGWALLVDRALLVLGALLTVAGVIFFFAFNWAKLSAFAKFGLIGAGIALAVAAAQRLSLARQSGKIALVVAALLVGPLLAVYGQHYQTGADPFELFLAWMLLATPWAIAARSSLLWGVVIGLADTTAGLFAEQVLAADGTSAWRSGGELPMIAGIHLVALVAIELGSRRDPNAERRLARLVALIFAGVLAFGASWWVFDRREGLTAPLLCVLGAPIAWGAMLDVYGHRRRDVAMLAIAGASMITVITSVVAKLLSEMTDSGTATVFLTGFALTAEVAALAAWLRSKMKGGKEA